MSQVYLVRIILFQVVVFFWGGEAYSIKKDLTKNIAKLKDGQRIKEDTLGYKFK